MAMRLTRICHRRQLRRWHAARAGATHLAKNSPIAVLVRRGGAGTRARRLPGGAVSKAEPRVGRGLYQVAEMLTHHDLETLKHGAAGFPKVR